MNKKLNKNMIDSPYVSIWLENGIIHFVYKPELAISLEVARQTVIDRKKVSKNVKRPVLADIRGMRSVENDAREYLASEEAGEFINAVGILTNSHIQKLFGNFYMRINRPPQPTRLFTDKKKALRWLEMYKNENLN